MDQGLDKFHQWNISGIFIKAIDDSDHGRDGFSDRQNRANDEFGELVFEILVENIRIPRKGVLHGFLNRWQEDGELICECGEELGDVTAIWVSPGKEETESEQPLIVTFLCYGVSDRRLSRPSMASKPAYSILIITAGPLT